MRFHHMGVFVSDIDTALRLWVDELGFTLTRRATIPDGRRADPGTRMPQETLDEGKLIAQSTELTGFDCLPPALVAGGGVGRLGKLNVRIAAA